MYWIENLCHKHLLADGFTIHLQKKGRKGGGNCKKGGLRKFKDFEKINKQTISE